MTLPPLYAIHDDLEAALRELAKPHVNLAKVRRAAWQAHDRLERVIVRAQARKGAR